MLPLAGLSVNEEAVIVVASIAREKVAVGATARLTAVAPLAGVTAVTVGDTVPATTLSNVLAEVEL